MPFAALVPRRAVLALLACAFALAIGAGLARAQQDRGNPQAAGRDAPADSAAQGRIVFERYCAPCHGPGPGDDGAPMKPGTHALFLKYRGGVPALLTERDDLPYEVLRAIVRNGAASMPPMRPTEVGDDDLRAIAAYLAAD